MKYPELIKQAHETAVDKGFYDCPECGGEGNKTIHCSAEKGGVTKGEIYCRSCYGDGKDQNKNIGELLMLIVSELGEALEAHRSGKFVDKELFSQVFIQPSLVIEDIKSRALGDGTEEYIRYFDNHFKDTFEDEIADVFIRLFDLCGYLGKTPVLQGDFFVEDEIISCRLFSIVQKISEFDTHYSTRHYFGEIIIMLNQLCDKNNIPIEKHITAKMAYNKTREKRHGKRY